MGARPGSRSDGELLRRQEGSRQRDDCRAKRVRKRRERADPRPVRAGVLYSVSLAQLRKIDDWFPLGYRKRPDRALAGVLPPALPARQRRVARGREVRRSQDDRPGEQVIWSDSAADAHASDCLHRPATAGWRGKRLLEARRHTQFVLAGYHIPAGADPDFAPIDLVVQILGDTPAGRLHKALVETKKAAQTFGGDYQLHDPGLAFFAAQVRQDASRDEARDALLQTVEDRK